MLQPDFKRSYLVFCLFLVLISAIPVFLTAFFSDSDSVRDLIFAGLLSMINALVAGYFAVSGKEGTFKRLLSSVFFRILTLAVIIFFLILNNLIKSLPFMYSFIGFYLLHQIILILWLKREIKLNKTGLFTNTHQESSHES